MPATTSINVDNSNSWSPAVYGKYAEERTRPGIDLIEGAKRAFLHRPAPFPRSLDDVRVICDLGSGTGRFEPHLLAHFPAAQRVIGIDGSDAMLTSARADVRATLEAAGRGALADRVTFQRGDIGALSLDTQVDLLFSNSALHWLPNHDVAVRHWLAQVRPGGVFAVQLPNNFSEPSHTCMYQVARRMEDAGSLPKGTVAVLEEKAARVHPGGPLAYHRLLRERCSFVDVWATTRYDTLREPEGVDKHGIPVHPVVAFTHGSALANLLMYLPDAKHREFLAEYTREMHAHYPTWAEHNPMTGQTDVVCVFPFSRWFLVGVVKAGDDEEKMKQ